MVIDHDSSRRAHAGPSLIGSQSQSGESGPALSTTVSFQLPLICTPANSDSGSAGRYVWFVRHWPFVRKSGGSLPAASENVTLIRPSPTPPSRLNAMFVTVPEGSVRKTWMSARIGMWKVTLTVMLFSVPLSGTLMNVSTPGGLVGMTTLGESAQVSTSAAATVASRSTAHRAAESLMNSSIYRVPAF